MTYKSAWRGPFGTRDMKKESLDIWRGLKEPKVSNAITKQEPRKIYLIECLSEAPDNKYIKIGVSTDCEKRLSGLKSSNPLPLKLIFESSNLFRNSTRMERWLHAHLDSYRISGEWFSLPDNLIKHIQIFLTSKHLHEKLKAYACSNPSGRPYDEEWDEKIIGTNFLERIWEECVSVTVPKRDYLYVS